MCVCERLSTERGTKAGAVCMGSMGVCVTACIYGRYMEVPLLVSKIKQILQRCPTPSLDATCLITVGSFLLTFDPLCSPLCLVFVLSCVLFLELFCLQMKFLPAARKCI